MILYHGTTMKNRERIIHDGKMRCQISREHKGYKDIIAGTTDEFVYLTKNLYTAYYYGNILLVGNADDSKEKYVYIFKIDIPDSDGLLEADFDELKVKKIKHTEKTTWKESLEMCGCVRLRRDINVKGLEYIKIPAPFNCLESESKRGICQNLSKIQLEYGSDYVEIENNVEELWKWKRVIE